jgi:dTDP-glucose 4,6-dehydratase
MKDRKILCTGLFGFIGSNFLQYWKKHHPFDRLYNIDCVTYAAHPLAFNNGITNFMIDIRDRKEVGIRIRTLRPDVIINFSAETHVCNSITDPETFYSTNVMGTFNLLDEFRLLNNGGRFIQISTDEVFGELFPSNDPESLFVDSDFKFNEDWPLSPRSPYAASKAAGDLMCMAYHQTYGMDAIVTNCSNNFGPYQHKEKLVPSAIHRVLNGDPIRLYGDGSHIRDWLYVMDHCYAIDTIIEKGEAGERYCIGGECELTNMEICEQILLCMDEILETKPGGSFEFTKDRPTDDFRYAIDCSKLKSLGWSPSINFKENLMSTVKWYIDQERQK